MAELQLSAVGSELPARINESLSHAEPEPFSKKKTNEALLYIEVLKYIQLKQGRVCALTSS